MLYATLSTHLNSMFGKLSIAFDITLLILSIILFYLLKRKQSQLDASQESYISSLKIHTELTAKLDQTESHLKLETENNRIEQNKLNVLLSKASENQRDLEAEILKQKQQLIKQNDRSINDENIIATLKKSLSEADKMLAELKQEINEISKKKKSISRFPNLIKKRIIRIQKKILSLYYLSLI